MRVSANTEAIGHLTRALALLGTLPATAERDQLELPLQMGLTTATIVARGYAAPGVRAALDRARELCRGAECTPQLIPVLRGLYSHYSTLAEHRAACELAQRLLALAHHALGQSQAELGDLVAARDTLERGLAYHDPEQYRVLAYLYGEEHGVSSRFHLMITLFALGYPDQAPARGHEALAMVEALAHPHVLAYTLYGLSSIHVLRREKVISLCREKRIPFWEAAASINRGHALAMQGRASEGIAEASRAFSIYRSIGAKVMQTVYLALLAQMYIVVGQTDAGLEALGQGLAAANETGERFAEAELYRLRVESLRTQGREVQAETDFYRALDVARGRSAKSWELRATLSLCRLWRSQGKYDEVPRILEEIHGWFTEGFDTADLQEARALLEELADK